MRRSAPDPGALLTLSGVPLLRTPSRPDREGGNLAVDTEPQAPRSTAPRSPQTCCRWCSGGGRTGSSAALIFDIPSSSPRDPAGRSRRGVTLYRDERGGGGPAAGREGGLRYRGEQG